MNHAFFVKSQALRRLAVLFIATTFWLLGPLVSTASGQAMVVLPGVTAVGASTGAQTVTVTIQHGGQLDSIGFVSQGIPNLDYAGNGTGSCSPGTAYVTGQSCTVGVVFRPHAPGQRRGAVTLVARDGTVLGSAFLAGAASGALGVFIPGLINTVAGDEAWVYRGDGGAAAASELFLPFGIAVDAAGNLYIADSSNDRIRRVDGATGVISTLAGNGNPGASGDGGRAVQAMISGPTSVAIDGAGNVYFADSGNDAIRVIGASTGLISTIAGTLGVHGFDGDGGLATSAHLNTPNGIALDGGGNLYIADTGNNVIRKLDLRTGLISRVAGTGVAAFSGDGGPATDGALSGPWSLTISPEGAIYIADQQNNRIRRVDATGYITTLAGTGQQGFSGDTGPASDAALNVPANAVLDVAGNLYIADAGNNRVRKVSAQSGIITTVAGGATEAFSGDGGPADKAGLYGPYGLALDGGGSLYIADVFHNRVRMIAANGALLNYPDMRVGRVSSPQSQTIENDGNATLVVQDVRAVTNAALDPRSTTCAANLSLLVGDQCVLGAQFAPQSTGWATHGFIDIDSNATNTPGVLTLLGNVLTLDPSTVTLTTNGSPAPTGSAVVFTVTVTSPGTAPTGTVTLMDGGTALGAATLTSAGVATFSTSTMPSGPHSITAVYSGDINNVANTSPPLTQVVKDTTTIALQSDGSPSTANATVTFTATIGDALGAARGTIVLLDGSTALGSAVVSSSGTAAFAVSTLSVGQHNITASYGGDSKTLASLSAALQQTVEKGSTTATLSTSGAIVPYGTDVTFTATVSGITGGAPSGTIVFQDGGVPLGTMVLDANGNAVFSTTTLGVGQHAVTAVYGGDGVNSSCNSAALNETVQLAGTTTTLVSNANPADAGAILHLTATTVSTTPFQGHGPVASPTGTVTFMDGGVAIGAGSLNGGAATLDISSLTVGQHSLTAVYAGNPTFAASTAGVLVERIQLATTSVAVVSALNPSIAGKPITFIASVGGSGGTPTGTVLFRDGTTGLGQSALNAQGAATFAIASLGVGTHVISAVYQGDASDLTATSASLSQVVNQAATGVVLTSSANPVAVGVGLTLRAGVSGNGGTPTGTITVRDGSTVIGAAALDAGGVASVMVANLTIGSHTLTAAYAGDSGNAASMSTALIQVVQQASTAVSLTGTPDPAPQGTTVQFTARVTGNGGQPGGVVQFLDGTTSLGTSPLSGGIAVLSATTLSLGQHSITAVYGGDANDSASTSAALMEIVQPTTVVTVTSNNNPASAGSAVTFALSVAGITSIPTGSVVVRDGSVVLGTVTLSPGGGAILTTKALTVGQHAITAAYLGDANNAPSTSAAVMETVNQATTQIVLSASSTASTIGTTVNVTAIVTGNGGVPTGSVTFLDGGVALGTVIIDSNGAAALALASSSLGQHTITAAYGGDASDLSAQSSGLMLTVQKASPALSIGAGSNPSVAGLPVVLTATVSQGALTPTGSVTWVDGGTTLGMSAVTGSGVSRLSVSNLGVGQHVISAVYGGDANNATASSVTFTETVQQGTSVVSIGSSNNPSLFNSVLTFTARVTSNGVAATGTISFMSGTTLLGSNALDATGTASLATSTLPIGLQNVVAIYGGDPSHVAGQSGMLAQQVLQVTTTTLVSSVNPSNAGATVRFAASVTGQSGAPVTGHVNFLDGSTTIGSSNLSSGVATYSTTALAPGRHLIGAVYPGDGNNQTSTSAILVEAVQIATSTIVLTPSSNPVKAGFAVTLTAQVAGNGGVPGGTVTFRDGSTLLGTGALSSSGVAAFTISSMSPGVHAISATYNGDELDQQATSGVLSLSVEQSTSVTLASSLNPAFTTDPVTFTMSANNGTGAAPTGAVTLLDSGAILGAVILNSNGVATLTTTALGPGQHVLTASYAGDAQNFAAKSAALTQMVLLRTTTNTLTLSAGSITVGQPVTFVSVVHGSGPDVPTGTVNFVSGANALGTATLDASGVAILTLTPPGGIFGVVAQYMGNSLFGQSTSMAGNLVVHQTTDFSMVLTPPNLQVQTMQHGTISVALNSLKGFADTLVLGCAGLPAGAVCTFGQDRIVIAADGSTSTKLTVDTSTPLGAGSMAQLEGEARVFRAGNLPVLALLLAGAVWRARRRAKGFGPVLLVLLGIGAMAVSGCGSSLQIHGTAPGSYSFEVTAVGEATGVTQTAVVTLKVTP